MTQLFRLLVTSGFDFGDQKRKIIWNVMLNLAERIDKILFTTIHSAFQNVIQAFNEGKLCHSCLFLHRLIYGKCYAIIESVNEIELDLVPFRFFFLPEQPEHLCNFVIIFISSLSFTETA